MGMWSTIYGTRIDSSTPPASIPPETRASVAHLQERVDNLVLINMAMWSLLRDKANLTEDDLMEKVRQIDLMDGVEDGKVTKHVVKCSQCERVMSPRHKRCMYCGAQRLDSTAFDSV